MVKLMLNAPIASLMSEFYQNLQKNPDKAIALRQAMLTSCPKNSATLCANLCATLR
jgi:hypothetical protein